jgi:hydrogenase/urease accessory protein HupE
MSKFVQNAIAIGLILLPAAAQAHPGAHGEGLAAGVAHAAASPDHVLTAAILATWAAALVWAFRWSIPHGSNSR